MARRPGAINRGAWECGTSTRSLCARAAGDDVEKAPPPRPLLGFLQAAESERRGPRRMPSCRAGKFPCCGQAICSEFPMPSERDRQKDGPSPAARPPFLILRGPRVKKHGPLPAKTRCTTRARRVLPEQNKASPARLEWKRESALEVYADAAPSSGRHCACTCARARVLSADCSKAFKGLFVTARLAVDFAFAFPSRLLFRSPDERSRATLEDGSFSSAKATFPRPPTRRLHGRARIMLRLVSCPIDYLR